MQKIIRKGSCLCQQVKFTIEGEPFHFLLCHCQNCQKASGSSYMANVWFKEQNLVVTEGQGVLKSYEDRKTASGRALTRTFCSNCGSSVFLHPSKEIPRNNDVVIISMSAIDDPHDWVPRKETYLETKHHWLKEISLRTKSAVKTAGKL